MTAFLTPSSRLLPLLVSGCSVLFASTARAQNPVKDSLHRVIRDPQTTDSLCARALFEICPLAPADSVLHYEREIFLFAGRRNYPPATVLGYRRKAHRLRTTGSPDSALVYFNKGIALATRLDMHESLAKIWYNMIWMYYDTGEIDKAAQAATEAIAVNERMRDSVALGNSYQQLGQAYQQMNDPVKALKALQKALTIGEDLGDENLQAYCYGSMGNLYYRQSETQKGINFTLKSIEIAERMNNLRGLAASYGNLGGMYAFTGNMAGADTADSRSLRAYTALGDRNNVGISKINIGSKLADRGKHKEGLAMVMEGHELLKTVGNAWPYNVSMKLMGHVYADMKRHADSKQWCLRAYEHSVELGLVKLQFDNLKCIYEACDAAGRHKDALLYYRLMKAAEDSIYSESRARDMATQETKYGYEKQMLADSLRNAKEKEVNAAMIVAQKSKIEQDRIRQLALTGGLALVVGFAAIVFNRFRVTRRQRDFIQRQKEEVEEKNREILQSIAYARRLQDAVLPPARVVKEFFADSFLLYLPKDIVSGDFYWMENRGSVSYFAVGDCTGHGVPGAMLSVIGLNGLNRCLNEMHITSPAAILEQLTLIFQSSFERSEATVRDGMDIGICALDNATGQLTFAGANNMLRVIRAGEVLEFKGDKRAVGFHDTSVQFSEANIPLQKGDILLLSTDGFADQFGGPEGKKFLNKRLRELLISLFALPMSDQRTALLEAFDQWREGNEQTDDVCVIGVRI